MATLLIIDKADLGNRFATIANCFKNCLKIQPLGALYLSESEYNQESVSNYQAAKPLWAKFLANTIPRLLPHSNVAQIMERITRSQI
jgi:hypothetical protein